MDWNKESHRLKTEEIKIHFDFSMTTFFSFVSFLWWRGDGEWANEGERERSRERAESKTESTPLVLFWHFLADSVYSDVTKPQLLPSASTVILTYTDLHSSSQSRLYLDDDDDNDWLWLWVRKIQITFRRRHHLCVDLVQRNVKNQLFDSNGDFL